MSRVDTLQNVAIAFSLILTIAIGIAWLVESEKGDGD